MAGWVNTRGHLWLVLSVMIVLGVTGSVSAHSLPSEWSQHLIRDLSVALFVAGLLAGTVDTFFKGEFARDAFRAAFSYVLPNELKQEITRIMDYKLLCDNHYMVLKLVPIDDDHIRLHISFERTIRNISRHKQEIKNSFAIDEWGFAEKSSIEICTMTFGGKEYGPRPRRDIPSDAVGMETDYVYIAYNEQVQFICKGQEIKLRNGEFIINFSYPSVNPVVDVHLPSGFSHSFGFGVPGGDERKSGIFERYQLNGTQFPGQFMRLRWWPTDTASSDLGHRPSEQRG
jgi:hypothetical protein